MTNPRIYNLDYNTTFQKAISVAAQCFEIEESNPTKGYIKCKTKASLLSWGENILIEIQTVGKEKTKITIDSSPSAQVFDWGKSKSNIDIFFKRFEAE